MNDRIKELMEQATEPPEFPANIGYFDREKFAELIIRECCDKFVSMQYKYPVSISAYEIKKHFGVEE